MRRWCRQSLSTQLSLTTNQRNPGCLVIAGNTGNVVCNTSFTDLSDSRVKTEIAEADVAELLQLFDSVEAAESGEMGARFGLEEWPEKVVRRDLRKVPENSAPEPRVEVQSR